MAKGRTDQSANRGLSSVAVATVVVMALVVAALSDDAVEERDDTKEARQTLRRVLAKLLLVADATTNRFAALLQPRTKRNAMDKRPMLMMVDGDFITGDEKRPFCLSGHYWHRVVWHSLQRNTTLIET